LYEGYGQFQVVAYDIEEAGEGELEKAYKKLLDKLSKEGLFEQEHKKDLPPYPERIAVVTSPTGAAVQDVLTTLERRWPYAVVVVVPVHVQGDLAAPEIVAALERLEELEARPDLIILGRGGGSLEDLWAFNEEVVARAIFKCPIPVVSAVGHETDFTIADFVADVRAATPTMAAELAVPLHHEVQNDVEIKIKWLLDYITTRIRERSGRLNEMLRSYALGRVRGKIENLMQKTDYSLEKLQRMIGSGIKDRRSVLDKELSKLAALNPKDILTRGYTICSSARTEEILRDTAGALDAGIMKVTFHDGKVLSEVKEKINDG
jgi:exodeoxyribonuclease VII large subunit